MRRRLEELLDRLDWALRLLDAFLITRDPAAAKSAEAFEGLRQTIEASGRARRRHLSQLATLHVTTRQDLPADDILEALTAQISQFAEMEHLRVVDTWQEDLASCFSMDGTKSGEVTIVFPAYIDEEAGELVKEGVAQRSKQRRVDTDTAGEGEKQ